MKQRRSRPDADAQEDVLPLRMVRLSQQDEFRSLPKVRRGSDLHKEDFKPSHPRKGTMNQSRHIENLRRMRGSSTGEERASLRYALNRIEFLETRLRSINRMASIRDQEAPESD